MEAQGVRRPWSLCNLISECGVNQMWAHCCLPWCELGPVSLGQVHRVQEWDCDQWNALYKVIFFWERAWSAWGCTVERRGMVGFIQKSVWDSSCWLDICSWLIKLTRYHICETKKHGEAGSVDQEAIISEQERVQEILARFPPKDQFNLDEMALLPFAVPDHGLATVHISRKKVNKFHITLALLCNADGSEKFPIFYIGKAKHPVAFNQQDPNWRGFCYCHNKTVWMASVLFDEWDLTHNVRCDCLLIWLSHPKVHPRARHYNAPTESEDCPTYW